MSKPATIVNVDDHAAARYARSRILTQAGFQVVEGANGMAAIDLVAQHCPDIVLLDVHLPDLNGIEVCRLLKARPEPVMVLQISATSVSGPMASVALNNGADAYLTEPVDAEVLVATVNALLRLRGTERELAEAKGKLEELNCDLRRSNDDLQANLPTPPATTCRPAAYGHHLRPVDRAGRQRSDGRGGEKLFQLRDRRHEADADVDRRPAGLFPSRARGARHARRG